MQLGGIMKAGWIFRTMTIMAEMVPNLNLVVIVDTLIKLRREARFHKNLRKMVIMADG